MLEVLKSSRFLFIFPDKGQKTSSKPYQKLADFSEKLGLEVYLLDISWKKHNSFMECALEATKKVHEIVDELRPTEIFFFGFGVGAIVAVEVGYLFRADGILLCSMPPLFYQELNLLPFFRKIFAKRKIYNAKNNPGFPSKKISVKTRFLYSEREKRKMDKFLEIRKKVFKSGKERFLPKSFPSLRRKKYFDAILEEMEMLVKQ